jgi:hypothetical protein
MADVTGTKRNLLKAFKEERAKERCNAPHPVRFG